MIEKPPVSVESVAVSRECGWQSPCGMRLVYQQWGEMNAQADVIVALHGWLDNSASFDRLSPLLRDAGYCVLALDLPGHGLSDARHVQGTYNLYDDIRQLSGWIDALPVSQVIVLGHSRGAMISLMMAASLPEKIKAAVFLDGLIPPPLAARDAPGQLANHVRDFSRKRRSPIGYESFEAALAARMKVTGMSRELSEAITRRALKQGDDACWYWRTDPRLRGASALRLTQELNTAFIEALVQPALLIIAENGMANDKLFRQAMDDFKHIEKQVLPGGHHFHLEPVVDKIAESIVIFLRSASV